MRLTRATPLDMRKPENIRDRQPRENTLDCTKFAGPDAPRDLTLDEARVLLALLNRDAATVAAIAYAIGLPMEADTAPLRETLAKLCDRGLIVSVGESAYRLVRPSGREFANLLLQQTKG